MKEASVVRLSIDQFRIDGGTQPRIVLDFSHKNHLEKSHEFIALSITEIRRSHTAGAAFA